MPSPSQNDKENPHQITIQQHLDLFAKAIAEEGWHVEANTFDRLDREAIPWPAGRLSFRIIRLRFLSADNRGVAITFERHAERLKKVFGTKLERAENLVSDQLVLHDSVYRPCVEWAVVDFSKSPLRTDGRPLADEMLVLAWMFPDFLRGSMNDPDACPFVADSYRLPVADTTIFGGLIQKEPGNHSIKLHPSFGPDPMIFFGPVERNVDFSTVPLPHVYG